MKRKKFKRKYCSKCGIAIYKRTECKCNAEQITNEEVVDRFYKKGMSIKDTYRAMKTGGFKIAVSTVSSILRNKGAHFFQTTAQKEQSKKIRILKYNEFECIYNSLPHYISQMNSPVFPTPNEYIMIQGVVSRNKEAIQKRLRITLP